MAGSVEELLDTQDNRRCLIDTFPGLADDANFKVLSECTTRYNCIAWAMGFEDRWVEPQEHPEYWWPAGAERGLSRSALESAFESVGFVKASDASMEIGFDKVVLYGKDGQWAHAARIIGSDICHSKFGGAWDCRHSIYSIVGALYGNPYCYMKRPVVVQYNC